MNSREFQTLHDECRERVLWGIRGIVGTQEEAEDATASAFATAYQKRKTFRGDSAFSTWVYRIAFNEARSPSRSKRTVSLDAIEGPPPRALMELDLMHQVLDRAQCCHKLRLALKRLPAKYRRALVHHFVRGYSTRQIARREGIPVGTVLSRIFNGKKRLRKAWELKELQPNFNIPL